MLILIRFLSGFGVPGNKIIIENKSRVIFENARYSSQFCSDKGFQHPILITAVSHMKRSVLCFEKEGIQVIPFPAEFETWNGKKYSWQSILPGNFRKSSIALHEHLGCSISA